MSVEDYMNKVFESKTFAVLVKTVVLITWIISGTSYIFPLPNATLRSQWVFGVLFGILFTSMMTWIVSGVIRFLCSKSSRFDAFVEKHWSSDENES